MFLEILHLAFMLFCPIQGGKRSEVTPLAGYGVLLAGIQAKLTGFEFANHVGSRCAFKI